MTDHISADGFDACLIDDGLVRFDIHEGTTISSTTAQAAVSAMTTLTDDVGGPVLVDLRLVGSVERDARKTFASATVMSRQALLIGSPLSRTIGNFFLTLSRPMMPVRLFDDEAAAIAWLRDER